MGHVRSQTLSGIIRHAALASECVPFLFPGAEASTTAIPSSTCRRSFATRVASLLRCPREATGNGRSPYPSGSPATFRTGGLSVGLLTPQDTNPHSTLSSASRTTLIPDATTAASASEQGGDEGASGPFLPSSSASGPSAPPPRQQVGRGKPARHHLHLAHGRATAGGPMQLAARGAKDKSPKVPSAKAAAAMAAAKAGGQQPLPREARLLLDAQLAEMPLPQPPYGGRDANGPRTVHVTGFYIGHPFTRASAESVAARLRSQPLAPGVEVAGEYHDHEDALIILTNHHKHRNHHNDHRLPAPPAPSPAPGEPPAAPPGPASVVRRVGASTSVSAAQDPPPPPPPPPQPPLATTTTTTAAAAAAAPSALASPPTASAANPSPGTAAAAAAAGAHWAQAVEADGAAAASSGALAAGSGDLVGGTAAMSGPGPDPGQAQGRGLTDPGAESEVQALAAAVGPGPEPGPGGASDEALGSGWGPEDCSAGSGSSRQEANCMAVMLLEYGGVVLFNVPEALHATALARVAAAALPGDAQRAEAAGLGQLGLGQLPLRPAGQVEAAAWLQAVAEKLATHKEEQLVVVDPHLTAGRGAGRWIRKLDDSLHIWSWDSTNLESCARVLSQSAAIRYYNQECEDMLERYETIMPLGYEPPDRLSAVDRLLFWRSRLPLRDLRQMVFKSSGIRVRLDSRLGLRDPPSGTWESARHHAVWGAMRREFELDDRRDNLMDKTELLKQSCLDLISANNESFTKRSELSIILLISVEIFISLTDMHSVLSADNVGRVAGWALRALGLGAAGPGGGGDSVVG